MTRAGERYLIVRLTAIGDVVHALPAVAALKRHRPDAEIDWLVDVRAAEILANHPLLARRLVLPGKRLFRRAGETLAALRGVMGRTYHAVFDLQGLVKSAVLAQLAPAVERWGFARRHAREPLAAALYDRHVAPPTSGPGAHSIGRGLAVVGAFLGRPAVVAEPWEFPLGVEPAREAELVAELDAARPRTGDGPLVVLNPGAAWESKQWPPEGFGAVAAALCARWHQEAPAALAASGPPRLVITWGPGEELLRDRLAAAAVAAHPRVRDSLLTFPTRISHLVPLLSRAALFVGADTGPMQIAAACGTPTVALFGPTWPWRNGPFAPADVDAVQWHRLACSGCYARQCPRLPRGPASRLPECMQRIDAQAVASAAFARLEARPKS